MFLGGRSLMLLIRRGQGLGWQRGSNVRSSAFHFQRYCKITIDYARLLGPKVRYDLRWFEFDLEDPGNPFSLAVSSQHFGWVFWPEHCQFKVVYRQEAFSSKIWWGYVSLWWLLDILGRCWVILGRCWVMMTTCQLRAMRSQRVIRNITVVSSLIAYMLHPNCWSVSGGLLHACWGITFRYGERLLYILFVYVQKWIVLVFSLAECS